MYSTKSYKLTKDEYNYLLPVLRNKLNGTNGSYFFTGDSGDLDDMLNRLKGLYDFYDVYNKIINYRCFMKSSLIPFREILK